MGHRGPDADLVAHFLDAPQLGHRGQVEERGQVGLAVLRRHQDVGPPRDRPHLARALNQDLERLLERAGPEVEGRRGLGCKGRRRGCGGDPLHRGEDLRVAGAATKVAGQGSTHLVLGDRARGVIEQRLRGHDHARDADAALRSPMLDERVLEGVKAIALGQALDGLDGGAIRLIREHQAGVDGLAVHEHRARAALALAAAFLGPGQAQVLAQHVDEPLVAAHPQAPRLAVHGAGEVEGISHAPTPG